MQTGEWGPRLIYAGHTSGLFSRAGISTSKRCLIHICLVRTKICDLQNVNTVVHVIFNFIYGLKTINPSRALRIIIIICNIIALLFIPLNYYVYSVRVFAVLLLREPIRQRFSTRVNIIIASSNNRIWFYSARDADELMIFLWLLYCDYDYLCIYLQSTWAVGFDTRSEYCGMWKTDGDSKLF